MASFELSSSSCDGHIKALSRAIAMASKISRDALLEFTPEKVRLCARTDYFVVKFVFNRDFFTQYSCDLRRKCFVNLKALQMPFKSQVLVTDRDASLRSQIKVSCNVEDEVNNQIVFKIGANQPAATLTYRLNINDLDMERQEQLIKINRTIDFARVEISPKQTKRDRFLLSAFNSFSPDIDQVTIRTSDKEIKFVGYNSRLLLYPQESTTCEFTHSREDFSTFNVKEEMNITVPLRSLKLFLNFVETNRVQTFPRYIFEGLGLPAHFIYEAQLFKGHFISATPLEYVPEAIGQDNVLALLGPALDESFIADENMVEPMFKEGDEELYGDEEYNNYVEIADDDEDDDDLDGEDGYHDNQSDNLEHLDGNLEGLDASVTSNCYSVSTRVANNHNLSAFGLNNESFARVAESGKAESIRSEIGEKAAVDPERAKDFFDLEVDPDEIENVEINYSSESSEE